MCGLAGWMNHGASVEQLSGVAMTMATAIVHRGPDDAGVWVDGPSGVALSHRRLSIVDLSAAGHQPMSSPSDRLVMVFNGEIYNHMDIRCELRAAGISVAWRGHSDTETLLAAMEHWGVEATLRKAVGMFAMAVWDRQDKRLVLARDRLGEKPMYYGWVGTGPQRSFVFGSELKALRAHPSFGNPVDRQALMQYLRFMYVPAPRSICRDIYKLEPGCMLVVQGAAPGVAPSQPLRSGESLDTLSMQRWWSLAEVVSQASHEQMVDEEAAVEALEQALSRSVQAQSLADVPLGAFLSGGIDSSTVVALMQAQSNRPVRTFTVGFHEQAFDESRYAEQVARHLGTDHTCFYVTSRDAQAVIPTLPHMYDEPFADSSQIPTHLVCRAARQHVTVALSGDAGDELFGGYNRYFWGPRVWSRLAWMPFALRRGVGHAIQTIPVQAWDKLGQLKPGAHGVARMGDKAHKLARRLRTVHNMDDLYRSLVAEWEDPAAVVRTEDGLTEPASLLDDPWPEAGVSTPELRMMYRDAMTYLSDDILCKVDRAAMAASLETRVPMLDHRVVELAWRIPQHMKIRDGRGKWVLRQVLQRHIPKEWIDRPKAGFGIPVGQWLRSELKDWAETLLDESLLRRQGYLHPEPIRLRWQEHLSGQRDHTTSLWAVLMFQAWLAQWEPGA